MRPARQGDDPLISIQAISPSTPHGRNPQPWPGSHKPTALRPLRPALVTWAQYAAGGELSLRCWGPKYLRVAALAYRAQSRITDAFSRNSAWRRLSDGRQVASPGKLRQPVARDCVVELVGLEPTTKVLWNIVGVRPTPLVGDPCRSPGVLLFCLIFLAFWYLNRPPECYGTWFESDQLPWSDTVH